MMLHHAAHRTAMPSERGSLALRLLEAGASLSHWQPDSSGSAPCCLLGRTGLL